MGHSCSLKSQGKERGGESLDPGEAHRQALFEISHTRPNF